MFEKSSHLSSDGRGLLFTGHLNDSGADIIADLPYKLKLNAQLCQTFFISFKFILTLIIMLKNDE